MANQSTPILERKVGVNGSSGTPDFQTAVDALAASQNSLSAIGAKVAQSASNQMATQLGYEQGKTPEGDLLPPITEFDANFANSYHVQADATLKLQGQKLLDDAQVEMSKPNRLSPQLIASTTAQLHVGLNKIAEAAPTAIKGQLQAGFDSQLLNQTTQYNEKMISEQRQDQKDTLINALDLAAKNAYELGSSGDVKGSANAVESAQRMAASAANSHFLTPEQARTAHDTVVQSHLDGQYTFLAMQALKEGKYPEFEKKYSENKPAGMSNEQWMTTGRAFNSQVTFMQSLRTQDDNLKSQQMLNQIAMNPSAITGTQWQTFADSVSQIKAEEVKFKYIQALKSGQSNNSASDALIQSFTSPEAFANSSDKAKNDAFNRQVDYAVQNSHKTTIPLRSPAPISRDEAEVQVAAVAGGKIPAFVNSLKNKLSSSNPAYIESAAQQIHALQAMGAGHALDGLDDQDKSLYTMYESLRDSRDPATAARDATQIVLNQDPEVQQANKQKWSNFLTATASGVPLTNFALTQFGMNQASFINPSMAQVYGSDILKKYGSYYQLLNGDQNAAKKLTQQYIDDNYGDTLVNGGSYKTLYPIEKVLGFKAPDAVPFIQQDVINQLNDKLMPIKEEYRNKKSNEYWETVPLNGKQHGIFHSSYDPIQIKRHVRDASGKEKTDTYNVVLQGNSFNSWDIAIQTEYGMRNLFQKAPYLGVVDYRPNAAAIRESYNKVHPLK